MDPTPSERAMDEILTLRAEVARLREILAAYRLCHPCSGSYLLPERYQCKPEAAARAALRGEEE